MLRFRERRESTARGVRQLRGRLRTRNRVCAALDRFVRTLGNLAQAARKGLKLELELPVVVLEFSKLSDLQLNRGLCLIQDRLQRLSNDLGG